MMNDYETYLSEENFTQDLDRLISFPTITGQEKGFDETMEFIANQVNPEASIYQLENKGERIFLASNKPTATPDVLYIAHIDVVNARPDQFQMRVENGIAYGRGVSDMKFSIPIGYTLLNNLIAENSPLSFMLAITTDEERGGFNGAGYLADKYGLKPGLAIVPDGGDDFIIINKAKGVCQLRVDSVGVPAHSSTPWKGENAVEPMVELLSQLLAKYGPNNKNEGWNTTMNIGTLNAGKSINQVCPDAHLGLDFRIPETIKPSDIEEEVKLLAQSINDKLSVHVTAIGEPTYISSQHLAFKLFKETLEKHLGHKAKVGATYGSSDARHFNKYGTPFIMTKPVGGDIHGENEYIDISSSVLYFKVLLEFLQKYQNL